MKILLAVVLLVLVAVTPAAAERFGRGSHLGFSIGTPAGLNVEYRLELGSTALTVAGGWYGSTMHGVQGGIAVARWGKPRTYFVGNLVAGHSLLRDQTAGSEHRWTYGGAELAFHHRRFFIAPGLSAGEGTYSSPQLLARAGFVWPL